jgi:membrane-bound inhibitor of C-type lysozyme
LSDDEHQRYHRAHQEAGLFQVALCLAAAVLAASPAFGQTPGFVQTVRYACEQGKFLTVDYFNGPARTSANGMPIPGGHVIVTLPDGNRLTLPQTLSGSGIRYASVDESFVFWSKGNTAFVEEGPNQTQTYAGCVGEQHK